MLNLTLSVVNRIQSFTGKKRSRNEAAYLARVFALACRTPILVKHLAIFTWLGTRERQTLVRTHLSAFRLCLEVVLVALTTSVRKRLARARVDVEVPSREGGLARAGKQRHAADCYQTTSIPVA